MVKEIIVTAITKTKLNVTSNFFFTLTSLFTGEIPPMLITQFKHVNSVSERAK